MEKKQFVGIMLIVLLTILMQYYLEWTAPPKEISENRNHDTTQVTYPKTTTEAADNTPLTINQATTLEVADKAPSKIMTSETISDSLVKNFRIQSDLIDVKITNQNGGALLGWNLLRYKFYQGGSVDLLAGTNPVNQEQPSLNVDLLSKQGKSFQLNDYTMFSDLPSDFSVVLNEENPRQEISFYLPVEGGQIIKTYIFYYDSYSVDVVLSFENMQNYLANQWYSLFWENGLHATEENIQDDYSYARAFIYQNGEEDNIDASEDESETLKPSGNQTDWAAIRTKYFLTAILPASSQNVDATITARGITKNDILYKNYTMMLGVPFNKRSAVHTDTFAVFMGPLDIDVLEPYNKNLDDLVMSGSSYESFFRPISRYIVLPSFKFLHGFISNYGLVILLFSVLIKLVLYPLTKKSHESMSRMQEINPMMTEIREKYKNEPQRLQKEMMKVYKDYGVNPVGGCIPMLLQMPLLFSLFIVFRSTIQLRGEPFFAWITDLSQPDVLALGFTLPIVGDSIHVLPFLMGITMIWQSQQTITDPKQKMMMYAMPVFMLFVFYSLPSGLNLYYALFNTLTMLQTRMIKKNQVPLKQITVKGASKNGASKQTSAQKRKPAQKSGKKKK